MGMAIIEQKRKPYMRSDGMCYCESCSATWHKDVVLIKGFRLKPTTDGSCNFHKTSDVPKGECPWCREKLEGVN